MTQWLEDLNGNRCSVQYFGSREAAQAALASLVDCKNCVNCSGCSDCLRNESGNFIPPNVPAIDNIHVKLNEAITQGKLDMSSWHTCGTTHCRAGWVVHLAGDAGYALEQFHTTALAAQLIYEASGFNINPCRFYDDNAAALADIERLAKLNPATPTTGDTP